MRCSEIKTLMHQVLDGKSEFEKQVEVHCQACSACARLWEELQAVELELTDMEQLSVPVDFSSTNWDQLAQPSLAEQPSLSKLTLVGLVIMVILLTSIWVIVSWNQWLDVFWQVAKLGNVSWISGEEILLGGTVAIKELLYYFVLLSALWQGVFAVVAANMGVIFGVVAVAGVTLYYLIKTREQLLF